MYLLQNLRSFVGGSNFGTAPEAMTEEEQRRIRVEGVASLALICFGVQWTLLNCMFPETTRSATEDFPPWMAMMIRSIGVPLLIAGMPRADCAYVVLASDSSFKN